MKDEKLRPYAFCCGLSLLQTMTLIAVASVVVSVCVKWFM